AALSHAVQAAAFERQREGYVFWTGTVLTAKGQETAAATSSGLLVAGYQKVQQLFLPLSHDQERHLREEAARGQAQKISDLYRAIYRPAVKMWSLLSANNRTIIIFLAYLGGRPDGYLWFEAVILNLILGILVVMNLSLGKRLLVREALPA